MGLKDTHESAGEAKATSFHNTAAPLALHPDAMPPRAVGAGHEFLNR
jgi:hypothetical protein